MERKVFLDEGNTDGRMYNEYSKQEIITSFILFSKKSFIEIQTMGNKCQLSSLRVTKNVCENTKKCRICEFIYGTHQIVPKNKL